MADELTQAVEALKRLLPEGRFAITCDRSLFCALERRIPYPTHSEDGAFVCLRVADVPVIYNMDMDRPRG